MAERLFANVEMFGKIRSCMVDIYGEEQDLYSKEKVLWVERAEDLYGQSQMKEPYCLLTREAWMKGFVCDCDEEKDEEHEEMASSDIEFLRSLAEKIFRTPVAYGFDQYDSDRLEEIANRMEAF